MWAALRGKTWAAYCNVSIKGRSIPVAVEGEADLEDLDSRPLNSTENLPACTDIGGITGFSTGVLQSCKNTGPVGYEHVGYNVGGIAGRSPVT